MWSDREAEQDFLGYTSYVSVLTDICTHYDIAPLTLGIFGSWGSGKTSLMKMLRARLDRDAAANKTKTLWFNAWRYEEREEAQSALIHAILAKLAEDKTLLQDAKDTFERLKEGASVLKLGKFIGKTLMTMTPDIDGLIECFKEESEKIAETMEQFDRDFESLLTKANISRIVVFIDDLDRCSSNKVIETFETIKLFLNTPACTFVIGADAAKIEQAVGEVYQVADKSRKKDYLEKIIQIPFTIPEQDLRDITCYVGLLLLAKHVEAGNWGSVAEARAGFYSCSDGVATACKSWIGENRWLFGQSVDPVHEELDAVMPYAESLGRGLRGNPRQIKRFLNILALRRKLADENELQVDPALLVKLTVLEYVWPDFFNALVDTLDPESGQSPLLEELAKVPKKDGASDSEMVAAFQSQPGLMSYLALQPGLKGTENLSPYLFLAQTSLTRSRPSGLLPLDEESRTLANSIGSEDRLRSRTASKQVAMMEPATVGAVVKHLLNDLASTTAVVVKTHILAGLAEIASKHQDQFIPVVRALTNLDPQKDDAVLLASTAFLDRAEKAGCDVPVELKEQFAGSSELVKALTGKRGAPKPKGSR